MPRELIASLDAPGIDSLAIVRLKKVLQAKVIPVTEFLVTPLFQKQVTKVIFHVLSILLSEITLKGRSIGFPIAIILGLVREKPFHSGRDFRVIALVSQRQEPIDDRRIQYVGGRSREMFINV